ncbi:NAD(P)-dependent alcohol dehydrogenase [Rhodococcus koreensis]
MPTVNALVVPESGAAFVAEKIERRELGPHDVQIDIVYSGVCHSDIHKAQSAATRFPLVPGHEIAGYVTAVGSEATRFCVGDRAGVGCMVDSCGECRNCERGLEQYCRGDLGYVTTYDGVGRDGLPTLGGYSAAIVVSEKFAIRLPEDMDLASAAPLLCAGITLYSPLRHWNAGPGKRVAILGFGGIGHVGVQISKALGAQTAVLDLSTDKREDAFRLGADEFWDTSDPETFTHLQDSFDLIISTVPAGIDLNAFIELLDVDGTLVIMGATPKPLEMSAYALRQNRRSVASTRIGGIAQAQEMIDFCAAHGIKAMVELIRADQIDEAYERVKAGDVKFRFVIDMKTLGS